MNNKLKVVDKFDLTVDKVDAGIINSINKYKNNEQISLAYLIALAGLFKLEGSYEYLSKIVRFGKWTLWTHISPYPQGCQPDKNHSSAHCNAGQVCVWHERKFIAILKPEGGRGMTHFSIQDKGTGQPIEDVFIQEMEDALREREKMIASQYETTLKLLKNLVKIIV